MRNSQVVRHFAAGRRAAAGNLQTDGRSLWSYDLKIPRASWWVTSPHPVATSTR